MCYKKCFQKRKKKRIFILLKNHYILCNSVRVYLPIKYYGNKIKMRFWKRNKNVQKCPKKTLFFRKSLW